jgi:TrkA domain protein
MGEIKTTHLPGVGDRYDFVTESGDRIGVVSHMDGRRDLIVFDRQDPDRCIARVRLSPGDLQRLSELSESD